MKKYITLIMVVMMTLLVTACGSSEDDSYNSDWQGALMASQGVQVEGIDSQEVFATYSEQAEIDGFMDALAIDQWEPAELSDDVEKEYMATFFKMGEDGNENVVGRIITYKNSTIVTLESLGLSLVFQVPESAVDYIKNSQP